VSRFDTLFITAYLVMLTALIMLSLYFMEVMSGQVSGTVIGESLKTLGVEPVAPPVKPKPIPPPGYHVPNLTDDDVKKAVLIIRSYDYIREAIDSGTADVKVEPAISRVDERVAYVLLKLRNPVNVERFIDRGGEAVKVRFVIWDSIGARINLNKGVVIGSLDLPKPLTKRALEVVLSDRDLMKILGRGPWFIFIPAYGSDTRDEPGFIVMFEKPVWVNETVKGLEILGWISTIFIEVEGNSAKITGYNLGAPMYKVELKGRLKVAEEIARAYAKLKLGRDADVVFIGVKGELAIFKADIDDNRELVISVSLRTLTVDELRSGIAIKTPPLMTCGG
jgi:hypothetical protein